MENFPNLRREKVTQIQESQRVPSKRNPKRPTARHFIIKMAKFQDKEKILKAAREKKEVTYNGAPKRFSIKIQGEVRSFLDKRSLKDCTSSKPSLQEMLKGLL